MGFEKYYLEREHDERIREGLNKGKNILIVGSPLSGKTRSVFEAFRRAGWRHFITAPNIEEPEKREYWFPFFFDAFLGIGRRRYLFLDDIDKYTTTDKITSLLRKFNEKECSFIATCRSGDELEKFETTELGYIFKEPIEIFRINEEQEKQLRKEIPKETTKEIPTRFDHTIGSIFLALEAMQQRYDGLEDDHEKVLLSIKWLYRLGVYRGLNVFPIGWVETICREKYSFNLGSDGIICKKVFNDLYRNNFIRLEKSEVRVEEAYLEQVIKEVDLQLDDFRKALLYFEANPEAQYHLGRRVFDKGEVSIEKEAFMTIAVGTFTNVLDLWTEGENYARVSNSLGLSYWRLSQVRDKKTNLENAIKCFTKAQSVFTKDRFPEKYAGIQNNLGVSYSELSGIEENRENLNRAIQVYEEALTVFIPDRFPIQYAMIHNNLGSTYAGLSDIEETRKNLNQAIRAFEKALTVYTPERFPIKYAMTRNNLDVSYGKLSVIKETEVNLQLVIQSLEETLTFYTLDQFPIDYATTQNNLGNAYQSLSSIEEPSRNLHKAIEAYREGLMVYTLDQFPMDYAMTQNNLGLVFAELSDIEETEENLRLSFF